MQVLVIPEWKWCYNKYFQTITMPFTEQRDSNSYTHNFGDVSFESQVWHWLSSLTIFMIFNLSKQILGWNLNSGHDNFRMISIFYPYPSYGLVLYIPCSLQWHKIKHK